MLKEIDAVAWKQRIDACLGPNNKFSEEQRIKFSGFLIEGIKACQQMADVLIADNEEVKILRKQIKKVKVAIDLIEKTSARLNAYKVIESFAGKSFQNKFGHVTDIRSINAYMDYLSVYTEGIYGASSKPGRKNGHPLFLCHMVCQGYSVLLGEEPAVSDIDIIAQSGDKLAGTPYENVCFAVGELANVGLAWSTCRQAANEHREGEGVPAMTIKIEPGSSLTKSIQKLWGN